MLDTNTLYICSNSNEQFLCWYSAALIYLFIFVFVETLILLHFDRSPLFTPFFSKKLFFFPFFFTLHVCSTTFLLHTKQLSHILHLLPICFNLKQVNGEMSYWWMLCDMNCNYSLKVLSSKGPILLIFHFSYEMSTLENFDCQKSVQYNKSSILMKTACLQSLGVTHAALL